MGGFKFKVRTSWNEISCLLKSEGCDPVELVEASILGEQIYIMELIADENCMSNTNMKLVHGFGLFLFVCVFLHVCVSMDVGIYFKYTFGFFNDARMLTCCRSYSSLLVQIWILSF